MPQGTHPNRPCGGEEGGAEECSGNVAGEDGAPESIHPNSRCKAAAGRPSQPHHPTQLSCLACRMTKMLVGMSSRRPSLRHVIRSVYSNSECSCRRAGGGRREDRPGPGAAHRQRRKLAAPLLASTKQHACRALRTGPAWLPLHGCPCTLVPLDVPGTVPAAPPRCRHALAPCTPAA